MTRKILGTAAALLMLMTVFAAPPTYAQPQNEVQNYYYDADWNLIGERWILCDGSRYTWGVTSGAAHRTTYSESCSNNQGTWRCYYWDNSCLCWVETDLAYCGL